MNLKILHESMQRIGINDLIANIWNLSIRDLPQSQFILWYSLYEGLDRDLKLWNGSSPSS